jgi:hypothetical protein
MTPTFSHEEIQELLGAYALNATEPEEREAVDLHLDDCPRCRAEVSELREVAALLANTGSPAPEGVWDRIVDALEEAPPPLRLPLPGGGAEVTPIRMARRLVSLRTAGALAAAAALVVAVLAVSLTGDDRSTVGDPASLATAAHLALNAPNASEARLSSADGRLNATAVVLPNGQGYLLAESLPALDADRTYQLWGAGAGPVVSLGVIGSHPAVVGFSASGGMQVLMITEEDAGGVPAPSSAPLLRGNLA